MPAVRSQLMDCGGPLGAWGAPSLGPGTRASSPGGKAGAAEVSSNGRSSRPLICSGGSRPAEARRQPIWQHLLISCVCPRGRSGTAAVRPDCEQMTMKGSDAAAARSTELASGPSATCRATNTARITLVSIRISMVCHPAMPHLMAGEEARQRSVPGSRQIAARPECRC